MSAKVGHIVTKNRPEHYRGYIPVKSIHLSNGDECFTTLYQEDHRIQKNNPVDYCSEWGKQLCSRYTNYCPNCGAKMEEMP